MRTPDDYQKLIADRCIERALKLGRFVDYIETGVCTGNSAEAVLSTGSVRFACLIDHFSNGNYCGHHISADQVRERLKPFEGLFTIREGDSKDILPTIEEEFDIGFVDGDHSKEGCFVDMKLMLPLLRDDGIMFVDDLTGSGLETIVREFAERNELKMTFHRIHEGLGELTR